VIDHFLHGGKQTLTHFGVLGLLIGHPSNDLPVPSIGGTMHRGQGTANDRASEVLSSI